MLDELWSVGRFPIRGMDGAGGQVIDGGQFLIVNFSSFLILSIAKNGKIK